MTETTNKNYKPLIITLLCAIIVTVVFAFAMQGQNKKRYAEYAKEDGLATSTVSMPQGQASTTAPLPSYVIAEVMKHNTARDCWVAIDNQVYDMTSFTSKHPGGAEAIEELCGTDGSKKFHGAHGKGNKGTEAVFTKFKIGSLTI